MIRFTRTLLVTLALSIALAFGAVSAAAAAPVPWESMDITFSDAQASPMLIVNGKLPDSAKLPAQVELGMPTGTTIQWVGEILGGPASEDPTVKYTVAKSGSMDVYSFTVTKARIAQAEANAPAVLTTANGQTNVALSWTATQDVPSVRMDVGLPPGAKIVKPMKGAEVTKNPDGTAYYQREVKNVKAGDTLAMTFSYAGGTPGGATTPGATTATPSPAAQSSGSNLVVPLVIIAALLAIGFALVVNVRSKMQRREAAKSSPRKGGGNKPKGGGGSRPSGGGGKSAAARKPAPKTQAVAPEDADEGDEGAFDAGDDSAEAVADEPAPPARNMTKLVATLAVVGAIVAGVAFGAATAAKPQESATGQLSKTFSSAAPCATAKLDIAVDAATAKAKSDEVFKILGTLPSITTVTMYLDRPRIEVGYCESKLNDQKIQEALAPTGIFAD